MMLLWGRGLRATYLVGFSGKNSTHEEVTVTQTLWFGHKGLDTEQRKVHTFECVVCGVYVSDIPILLRRCDKGTSPR